MPYYYRVLSAINATAPFLASTQKTNLALLVSAVLKKRTLCLSELARAYPTPKKRRVRAPKHDLLHRLKRLWRFTANERVEALGIQLAFVPHAIARLGHPRLLGLAIDWTMFDTTLGLSRFGGHLEAWDNRVPERSPNAENQTTISTGVQGRGRKAGPLFRQGALRDSRRSRNLLREPAQLAQTGADRCRKARGSDNRRARGTEAPEKREQRPQRRKRGTPQSDGFFRRGGERPRRRRR